MTRHEAQRRPLRFEMRAHPRAIFSLALGLLLLAIASSVFVGAVRIPAQEVASILVGEDGPHAAILLHVRLPRAFLAIAVGAALAICGVLMQTFFRNPLADPALIGVSAGGAFGAVCVIVLGGALASSAALPLAAFVGSIAAASLVLTLARRDGMLDPATMLLAGIAMNALAGAGIGLVTYLANDAQLRNLTFWSPGSLAAGDWTAASLIGAAAAVLIAAALSWSTALNALLLGDSEARHLGFDVERLKILLIAATCASAGAAVAYCGVIGFIGLIAPHTACLVLGPDHRRLIPLAAILGAALLAGADVIARTVAAPTELPIGVLTAILGAPLFLGLLRRRAGAVLHA